MRPAGGVIGFMSGGQQHSDMMCEVFILAPTELVDTHEIPAGRPPPAGSDAGGGVQAAAAAPASSSGTGHRSCGLRLCPHLRRISGGEPRLPISPLAPGRG